MAFNLTEFLASADFPSREARQNVEAWLQEIECTTRGTLRGLDVDKHAPAEIIIGWRAALRDRNLDPFTVYYTRRQRRL